MRSDNMIKVEAIKQFTLADYDKITNIQRKSVEKEGMLYVGDTFECDEKMAKYLTGNNDKGNIVVKIIEVIPDKYEPDKNAKLIKITNVGGKEVKPKRKLAKNS